MCDSTRFSGLELNFIVDSLAVLRLTRLVTEDTIFDAQREWVALTAPDKIAYLVTCPHCVSIHLGIAAVVLRKIAPRAWNPFATALALSAVTSVKTEFLETLDQ